MNIHGGAPEAAMIVRGDLVSQPPQNCPCGDSLGPTYGVGVTSSLQAQDPDPVPTKLPHTHNFRSFFVCLLPPQICLNES